MLILTMVPASLAAGAVGIFRDKHNWLAVMMTLVTGALMILYVGIMWLPTIV